MRKLFVVFSWILFSASLLYGDADDEVLGSESITEPVKESPVSLRLRYDYVGASDFEKKKFQDQKIRFGEGAIDLTGVVAYNRERCEGGYLVAGYISTYLGWKENPFFSNQYFNRANLNAGIFSKRFPTWFWSFQAGVNLDTDRWDLWEYATYDIVLWGRKTYREGFHIHTGVLIQTGMKMDRFYPILGFDWEFWRCVTINAVFPMNLSIVYKMTPRLSTSFAARFFNSRSRAGAKERLPMAVWRYENTGLEGNFIYEIPSRGIYANVHAGWALGGNLRIANRHNKHPKHFKFQGAPYAGGEVSYKF